MSFKTNNSGSNVLQKMAPTLSLPRGGLATSQRSRRPTCSRAGMTTSAPLAKEAITQQHREQSCVGKQVKLIISDVDGTLLNSMQELTAETVHAIRKAADRGISTILATGKAPGPWLRDVVPCLPEKMPMVFLQGLLVRDAHGRVIYERGLPDSIVEKCVLFGSRQGLALAAYCGDRILCESRGKHVDRLMFYKEPTPEPVGPLPGIVGQQTVHKLIYFLPDEEVAGLRQTLTELLGDEVSFTTALPGMLEVLPPGASKGSSVARLLEELGMDAENVMAIGDGENDIEMLRLSGVAVAMGNARQEVKDAADYIVASNDENGFAEALSMFAFPS